MAPTNVTRSTGHPVPTRARRATQAPRLLLIRAGKAILRARLLATPTADRIWAALPLHSTIETWGEAVHFETPVETGRERGARQNVTRGEIAYWPEEDRIIIAFGPTPISGAGEMRLPSPANIWAEALDDVGALAKVRGGTEVSLDRLESPAGSVARR